MDAVLVRLVMARMAHYGDTLDEAVQALYDDNVLVADDLGDADTLTKKLYEWLKEVL